MLRSRCFEAQVDQVARQPDALARLHRRFVHFGTRLDGQAHATGIQHQPEAIEVTDSGDGYNAFYGRTGSNALPAAVTASTWERFFNPAEPVFALVAEAQGAVVGLCHYLFHRSTTRIEPVCYLQDLFTLPEARGQGVGRALILATYEQSHSAGARRVYWQTQSTNTAGRSLYDKVAKHLGS